MKGTEQREQEQVVLDCNVDPKLVKGDREEKRNDRMSQVVVHLYESLGQTHDKQQCKGHLLEQSHVGWDCPVVYLCSAQLLPESSPCRDWSWCES